MKNKKVLITGASRGIGRALVNVFLSNQWKVCIASRNLNDLKSIQDDLDEYGNEILTARVDFSKKLDVLNLQKELSTKWGGIDTIIANVGSGKGKKRITAEFKDNFDLFNANFTTAHNTISLLKNLLRDSKAPSITFIGSIASKKNVDSPISYAMAKSSIENYTKFLSVNLSLFGVRVNCVRLGHVLTESSIWAKRKLDDIVNFNHLVKQNTLTNKIITPSEAAELIYVVNSSVLMSNLTGSSVLFDAGTSLR